MRSPGARLVSMCGVSPGRRCRSAKAIVRLPASPQHFDAGVECHEGRCPIPRVQGHAVAACAQHGVSPVGAVEGGAARARHPLVALVVACVPEVRAARALEDVAAQPGHVAELLGRGLPQALGQERVVPHRRRIGLQLGHGHQRADAQLAVDPGDPAHRLVRDRGDVDNRPRLHDIELHQVDQRRPAALVLHGRGHVRACGDRGERDGGRRVRRHLVNEGAHQVFSISVFAWFTAATMLG